LRPGQFTGRGAFRVYGRCGVDVDAEDRGRCGGRGVDAKFLDQQLAELLSFGVAAVVDDAFDVLAEGLQLV
jgi:hypothetical protein